MTIGRIAPVEPIQNKEVNRPKSVAASAPGDSVHISPEAKEKAELFGALDIVSSTTDVRADRIAELKAKIDDPSYLSEKLIAGAADNIIDMLFSKSAR
ncbi:MAG: flagellar biosynthesis anti-sigma factor FlgM [Spirochaetaceae bacterium]|jgi:negative regulator of flagellin synthesis FlgM|nr:flagellar biosynthesis anti-sigma factor FlgM [Spirochaetaceae bacterium]